MNRPIETYRGIVYPRYIDHVGHMNVQSYVGRFDEASWHFLAHLGLTPAWLKEHERALVALEQRISYQREVLAGALLEVQTSLNEVLEKNLRLTHRMRFSDTGQVAAVMELLVGFLDTTTRRLVPFPRSVVALAEGLRPVVRPVTEEV